ncbi:MAG: hypothetical protein ACOWWR_18015 [Eubacteriales bacterium]
MFQLPKCNHCLDEIPFKNVKKYEKGGDHPYVLCPYCNRKNFMRKKCRFIAAFFLMIPSLLFILIFTEINQYIQVAMIIILSIFIDRLEPYFTTFYTKDELMEFKIQKQEIKTKHTYK